MPQPQPPKLPHNKYNNCTRRQLLPRNERLQWHLSTNHPCHRRQKRTSLPTRPTKARHPNQGFNTRPLCHRHTRTDSKTTQPGSKLQERNQLTQLKHNSKLYTPNKGTSRSFKATVTRRKYQLLRIRLQPPQPHPQGTGKGGPDRHRLTLRQWPATTDPWL